MISKIDLDGLNLGQKGFVNQVLNPGILKNPVVRFGFIQRQGDLRAAATAG